MTSIVTVMLAAALAAAGPTQHTLSSGRTYQVHMPPS